MSKVSQYAYEHPVICVKATNGPRELRKHVQAVAYAIANDRHLTKKKNMLILFRFSIERDDEKCLNVIAKLKIFVIVFR
jgi:hypothetical protein